MENIKYILASSMFSLPFVSLADIGDGCLGWGNYGMMGHSSFGLGFFGIIFNLIFWAAVIFGIVYLVKLATSHKEQGKKEKSALDILKERYAKGEIKKEEFEEKKKEIE